MIWTWWIKPATVPFLFFVFLFKHTLNKKYVFSKTQLTNPAPPSSFGPEVAASRSFLSGFGAASVRKPQSLNFKDFADHITTRMSGWKEPPEDVGTDTKWYDPMEEDLMFE